MGTGGGTGAAGRRNPEGSTRAPSPVARLSCPNFPTSLSTSKHCSSRLIGQTLDRALLKNPFLLRSVEPSLQSCEGHHVRRMRRLGKRIAIGFDNDLWLVIHLMIAGPAALVRQGRTRGRSAHRCCTRVSRTAR